MRESRVKRANEILAPQVARSDFPAADGSAQIAVRSIRSFSAASRGRAPSSGSMTKSGASSQVLRDPMRQPDPGDAREGHDRLSMDQASLTRTLGALLAPAVRLLG